MNREGSWISALKRIFICSSEAKVINGSRKRRKEEKGVKIRKQRHDDRSPFVTLFSGTSSIEKILEDAENENQLYIQTTTPSYEQESSASAPVPFQPLEKCASPLRASSPSPHPEVHRINVKSEIPGPSFSHITDTNHAALIIQTSYRGYVARRSLRALKGLVRLQGVVRGPNVKRQTTSAMNYMQLLFRVQSRVGFWRGEMLERRRVQQQQNISQTEVEGDGQHGWDDSRLLKGEREDRLQRKCKGFAARERAVSYSYSNQSIYLPRVLNLLMAPSSGTASSADVRSVGYQWWWNWVERGTPGGRASTVKVNPRRSWPGDGLVASPLPRRITRGVREPSPLNRPSHAYSPARSSYCSKPRTGTWNDDEDEESFTSCPHFSSSPSYMSPTVSAIAKARATHPLVTRPGRRLSYPLTPIIPSSKWNSGLRSSISSSKESEPRRHSPLCLADKGTFSSPTSVVRMPFNRFV